MSELIQKNDNRATIRWKLLTSASAAALIASACGALAADDGTGHPLLWIELGAQFEQVGGRGDIFAPPFVSATDWKSMNLISPATTQTMAPYSFGGEGNISFQPEGSDWVFSAGIRYGRSHGRRNIHDQPQPPKIAYYLCPNHCLGKGGYFTKTATNYENTSASSSESHTILDFQAGKDVGLGMFGKKSTSVLSAGIRFAQFSSNATVNHRDAVDTVFYNGLPSLPPPKYFPATNHHAYALSGHAERSFRGIGPSVSWKASAPIVGTAEDAGITFDWGINAAVLFGRQRAKVSHQTTGQYYIPKYKYHNGFPGGLNTLYQHAGVHSREHSVVVPNLGGMAGISFRYADAKVSFGYRGDFFFGAIDGGIDTRKSTTRGFYGPFATFSVGIGD